MPGGLSLSIGLIYVATALFCLCVICACAILVFCYARFTTRPAMVLPPPHLSDLGPPEKPLALVSPQATRDVETVRSELDEALTRAEALKAELDGLLSDETGPSQFALSMQRGMP